jgi:tetratricopeptide (TPR) repeat protein
MLDRVRNSPIYRTIAAGEKALANGKFKKAVALFSQVIENPTSSQLESEILSACYLNRGFALRKIGRQQEALQDYTRASQLNPMSFKPYLNAALIYAQDFGRYQESLAEFDKAIELNPTCTEALSSRGLTKTLLGDLEGAEEDLRAALSVEPNNPDALCNLGSLYLQRRQPQEAAEMYRQALEANPRDAEIRVNLAIALTQMGLERAAESALQEDNKALRLWEAKGGWPIRPRMRWPFILFLVAVFIAILLLIMLKLGWHLL